MRCLCVPRGWCRFDASGVTQGNRERHDDHASKREIEIHKVVILSLLSVGPF